MKKRKGSDSAASQSVEKVLAAESKQGLTWNDVLTQNGGRGAYLLMILLCLPFISPIPVPGLSNVIGLIIAWLGFQLVFTHAPSLPRFVGKRTLSSKSSDRLARYAGKILKWLGKVAKPRFSQVFNSKPIEIASAASILVMGLLLALPIPPVVPFTNSLPAWGIIAIALATMSKDGILIWIGYLISAGAFIYLALFAKVVVHSIETIWQHIEKVLHFG